MFETFELGRFTGRPVHLFVFTRQGLTWRYASSDRDIVIGGNTYLAAQIERSEIKVTAERAKDRLTIKLAYVRDPAAPEFPVTQPLGDNWHPYIPSDPVHVVCLSTHVGDTDPPAVEWMGVVTQPKFGDVELELICEPTNGYARARNQGPKWQRGCWKTVYSEGLRGCNLSRDAFKVDGTLTAVAGLTVTAAAFATAPLPLVGGYLTWTRTDGLEERRSIMAHTGDTVTLLYGAADLAGGMAVTARPGCPRTWAACEARSNTVNYGGSVYKPVKNPMDGVSMSWG
ncbi:phage BR0599 family protein [Lysobacter olei]